MSRPLIAILRGLTPPKALPMTKTLISAGIDRIEVPLNSPDPFASMEKELAEELALAAEDFVLRCIGLVLARKTRKPELIFRAHPRLTSAALLQAATAAQDRYE